jgi:biofilm PGA synthesis protein PgaA
LRSFELTLSVSTFFVVFLFMCLAMEIFLPVISPIVTSFVVHAQLVSSFRAKHSQESQQKPCKWTFPKGWSTRQAERIHESQQETTLTGDPDTILERARGLVKTGNYREALAVLAPFVSKPMEHPAIFSDYLVILFWDGQLDKAIRMYETLRLSFPRRAYLLRNMAKAYYDKGRFLKAVSLYQAAVKQAPADEEAQRGLVLSLIQIGDLDKAYDYLERFLKRAPDSSSLALLRARVLMWQGKYLEALDVYHVLSKRKDVESEEVYKTRDDLIASLSVEEREAMLDALIVAAQQGDEQANLDYILVLTLNKDYKRAIESFETANIDLKRYPDHLVCWIAWAYFKTGKTRKAKLYYQAILAARPHYVRPRIGLAYCLSAEGEGEEAIAILDKLLLVEPQNLEIRFARAFAHEKARRFWSAIGEYDRILEISPGNPVARKLRLRAFSDMGARSYALEEAYKECPQDYELRDSLIGDMAADRIRWEEPKEAINLLLPLMENRENLKSRFEHIIALANGYRMEEVVKSYENLVKDGISPPPWVLEKVAEAYLYMEEPYKALKLYDRALATHPSSFSGRMGKFYALQDIRDWDRARKVLDDLDKEIPAILGTGKNVRANWPKLDIVLARGWFLAYEGRLREAKQYFWDLYEKAPAQTEIRSGLAHIYLWRGWPRKALREFRIIDTLDPKYGKAQIGKMAALNELAFKEEARDEANSLMETHPEDKHLQHLVRQFEVEEMRELVTHVAVTRERGGADDTRAEITASQPLSYYTRLYGTLLWQKTWEDRESAYFRRAGMGINHIFNSSWSLKQQFSVNYDDGGDFGSLTQVNFYPDDYWRFGVLYDSFTTDVPMRARVYDIESKKFEGGITFRESEWRSYHLSVSHLRFSDDNDRDQALLGYEQGLLVRNDWKMRLFLDLYTSRNSRDDAPYFNPENDFSLSATHMTEHTVWRIYDRAFVHRLYLTVGSYKQHGFSNEMIGAIRYEQGHDFSDTQALLLGGILARNSYDGDPMNSYSLYLTYRCRF